MAKQPFTKPGPLLRAARKRLSVGLAKGAYARDLYGKPCEPEAPQAAAWCPIGAIEAVVHETGTDNPGLVSEATGALSLVTKQIRLTRWADGKANQAQVLRAFDQAIALVGKC